MQETDSSSACNSDLVQVYTENHTILVKFANRLNSGNSWCPSNAEDIVQEVFFRISPPSQTQPKSSKNQLSYLFQIVHNLSVDHYRKQSLINKYFIPDNTESCGNDLSIDTNSPERTCRNEQALIQISDAVEELPERTRYAFVRHRVYGVAQKDIAKEIGVSNTLVNFMIRDALKHCRMRMLRSKPKCIKQTNTVTNRD